jgi:hypothetical protein
MTIEVQMVIMEDGKTFGWQDNIVGETDEPYSNFSGSSAAAFAVSVDGRVALPDRHPGWHL